MVWKAERPTKLSDKQSYIKLVSASEESHRKIRYALNHIRLLQAPTFLKSCTTFRCELTSELRTFARRFHTTARPVLVERYKCVFGTDIPEDVLEEGMQLVHGCDAPYFQIKFQELYDNLRTVDITYSYSIEIELRGVFLKENRVTFDWRLVQVMIKEPLGLPVPSDDEMEPWDPMYDDLLPDPEEVQHMALQLDNKLHRHLDQCCEQHHKYAMLVEKLSALYDTFRSDMTDASPRQLLEACEKAAEALTDLGF